MNQAFQINRSGRLQIGRMQLKLAVAAMSLSISLFGFGLEVPVFAQTSTDAQKAAPKQTKSGSDASSGLQGATEAQAKPLKGGEQFLGSIIEKRNAFKVKGIHQSIEIPSNFPVPTYPNNVSSTNFVNSTVGTPVASVSIITSDSPKMTYDWYQTRCSGSGWSVTTPPESAKIASEKKGTLYRMSALKDGQQLVFYFMQMKKSPRTVITINWILKYKTG